jgi:hypothetical protein
MAYRGQQTLPFQSAKHISGRSVFKRSKLDQPEASVVAEATLHSQARRQASNIEAIRTEEAPLTVTTIEHADERSSQISAASRNRRQIVQQHAQIQAFTPKFHTDDQRHEQAQDFPSALPTSPPRQKLTLNEELALFDFPDLIGAQDHGPTASFGRATVRHRRMEQVAKKADLRHLPAPALPEPTHPVQSDYGMPDEVQLASSQSTTQAFVPYYDSNNVNIPTADWLFSPTPSASSRHDFHDQEPPLLHASHNIHNTKFETGLEGFEDLDELPDEDLASDMEVDCYDDGVVVIASSGPDRDNEHYDICQYDPQEHCCSSDIEERAMECHSDMPGTFNLLQDNYHVDSVDASGYSPFDHPSFTSANRHAHRTALIPSSPPHRNSNARPTNEASSSRAIDLDDPAPFRQGRAALYARGATAASLAYDHPPSSARQKQRFWKPYIQ